MKYKMYNNGARLSRLPSRGDSKPVLVSRKRRDEITELNYTIDDFDLSIYEIENKIYINDSLSPKMKTLHYHARQHRRQQKIYKSSTENGMLKTKLNEGDY